MSGFQRAFLKFDLSDYASVESAVLYLYNYSGGSSAVSINAYSTSNTWNETSVTWNNQPPGSGSPVVTTLGTAGGWYTWDVTSLANAAVGNHISLVMTGIFTVRQFYSDETANTALRPYLDITGAPSSPVPVPATALLLAPGIAGLAWVRRRLGV